MSDPCKNCDRNHAPIPMCERDHGLTADGTGADCLSVDDESPCDACAARSACRARSVNWRTRCLAAEAEALSLRVAAAANLEKLRALKVPATDFVTMAHNRSIDAAIRTLDAPDAANGGE